MKAFRAGCYVVVRWHGRHSSHGHSRRVTHLFHPRCFGDSTVTVDKSLPAVLLRVWPLHSRPLRHLHGIRSQQSQAAFPGFRGRFRYGGRGSGRTELVPSEALPLRGWCHRRARRCIFARKDVFEFDLCHFRCHNLDWHRCSFTKSFFQHK